MTRLIAAAVLSTAGVLTGLGAGNAESGEVGASGEKAVVKQFATTYSSPSTESLPVHHLMAGREVDAMCFREGQVIAENPLWFLIEADGRSAWIHRDLIVPPAVLPHC